MSSGLLAPLCSMNSLGRSLCLLSVSTGCDLLCLRPGESDPQGQGMRNLTRFPLTQNWACFQRQAHGHPPSPTGEEQESCLLLHAWRENTNHKSSDITFIFTAVEWDNNICEVLWDVSTALKCIMRWDISESSEGLEKSHLKLRFRLYFLYF